MLVFRFGFVTLGCLLLGTSAYAGGEPTACIAGEPSRQCPAVSQGAHVAPGWAQGAQADDRASDTPADTHWYGYEVMLADGAAIALLGTAVSLEDAPVVTGLALTTYALGGAVVHGLHGRVGASFGSLALRVALPVTGAALGAASASGCDGSFCALGPTAVGLGVGMLAAPLIDWTVLSHEQVHPRPRATFALVPEPGGARLGVAASF